MVIWFFFSSFSSYSSFFSSISPELWMACLAHQKPWFATLRLLTSMMDTIYDVCTLLVNWYSLFAGPIASSLTNRFGCRVVTIAGSVLAATGMAFSVLAKSVAVLYFTVGICTGRLYVLFLVNSPDMSRSWVWADLSPRYCQCLSLLWKETSFCYRDCCLWVWCWNIYHGASY